MWNVILITLSYTLSDVTLVVGINMFPDIFGPPEATPAISLRSVMETSYAGVPAALVFVMVSAINVDVLAAANADGLAVGTTPLEFTFPSP